jgi:hypothetical protein
MLHAPQSASWIELSQWVCVAQTKIAERLAQVVMRAVTAYPLNG